MARIVWVDNDQGQIRTWVIALRSEGHHVDTCPGPVEAEALLAVDDASIDLLVLDVMMHTRTAEEERSYPPDETDRGREAGLHFFRRNKARLAELGVPVLVVTNRLDADIERKFTAEGLPPDRFGTKVSLRTLDDFLAKIQLALGGGGPTT